MFGMSEGCFIKVTDYILDLICEKSHLIIKWPNKEDYEDIAHEFNKRRIRYKLDILLMQTAFIWICSIKLYKNIYMFHFNM